MTTFEDIEKTMRQVQAHICAWLGEVDSLSFHEDKWDYHGQGGGITRVWENANLIEKGGVNFSGIGGETLPTTAATAFRVDDGTPFRATGVSLVLHPHNPFIPTVHMNIRYFEAGDKWWFGGGIDLTPYYIEQSDVVDFHQSLKDLCESHDEDYEVHKKHCDEYFYLKHRDEQRGVGGLFFDHLQVDKSKHLAFVKGLGLKFNDLYRPFIEKYRDHQYSTSQREFQLYRRSRYVEFNLIYDRGTLFGLQSGGRVESIFMSLPAVAHWRYDFKPLADSPEEKLTDYFLKPQDWLNTTS